MATQPAPAPLPPGRTGLPLIGETRTFLSDPFTFVRSRFREHGPIFKTSLFGKKVAFCVGPDALAKFSDPEYVVRAGATPGHVMHLIGNGTIPFLDGARQKRNKRLLLPAFQPEAMAAYGRAITPLIDEYLARWERMGEFAWHPEMEGFVLRAFLRVLFGAEPRFERRDMDECLSGLYSLPVPLPWGGLHRAKQARERLLAQVGGAVSKYRGQSPDTVVSRAAAARDEEGTGLTDQELTFEMLHLFFAGYAALAGALTNTVTALGDYPEACARARAEVRRLAAGEVSFETVGRLEYLGRVWQEVNRYYPAFPNTFFVRVIKEFECEGARVPVGWLLNAGMDAALHNPRFFHEPDTFNPERFAPPRSEHRQHEWAYVPHGGGPADGHRCAGEVITATVVKLMAAGLLRDYSWRIVSTDRSYDMKTFPPRPKDGLRVRFERAGVAPA